VPARPRLRRAQARRPTGQPAGTTGAYRRLTTLRAGEVAAGSMRRPRPIPCRTPFRSTPPDRSGGGHVRVARHLLRPLDPTINHGLNPGGIGPARCWEFRRVGIQASNRPMRDRWIRLVEPVPAWPQPDARTWPPGGYNGQHAPDGVFPMAESPSGGSPGQQQPSGWPL
jgi:hypothetical protein